MKGRLLGASFAIVAVVALFGVHYVNNQPPKPVTYVSASPAAFSYSDPYFDQMAQKLGLTGAGLKLYQDSNPIFSDSFQAHLESQQAEYSDWQIKIGTKYRGQFDQQAVSVVAHEYLHALWFHTTTDQRNALSGSLQSFYQKYKANFDRRMGAYAKAGVSGDLFNSELHSIIGTEVRDDLLPSDLLNWYIQWLPNRDALPSYFVG